MLLFYSFVLVSCDTYSLYRGNWSGIFSIKDELSINDSSVFQIAIDDSVKINEFEAISARAYFANTSLVNFPSTRFQFHGYVVNSSTNYMFSIPYSSIMTINKTISLLKDILKTIPENNFVDIHNAIKDKFFISPSDVISIVFNYTNNVESTKVFDLDTLLSGYMIWEDKNITIMGMLFDINSYVREGKIFGVITAFGVAMSFYAWYSISETFQSNVQLSHLSIHSFILHIGFDFSYSLFIFDLSMSAAKFSLLYSFLFLSMLCVYFGIQMKQLALIWRAHNADIGDADLNEIRFAFFKFFGEVSLLMSLSSLTTSAVFDSPVICLSYLYSFFLPQIIHSAFTPGRKTGDLPFVFLVSINRLFPLWYFSIYDKNLVGTRSNTTAILVSSWVLIQISIIMLQNKYGGAFFLPSSMKPNGYNYFTDNYQIGVECAICMAQIEESDEHVMVTPCGHSFHQECLSRWMDEQLICPLCRAPIPPLEETPLV